MRNNAVYLFALFVCLCSLNAWAELFPTELPDLGEDLSLKTSVEENNAAPGLKKGQAESPTLPSSIDSSLNARSSSLSSPNSLNSSPLPGSSSKIPAIPARESESFLPRSTSAENDSIPSLDNALKKDDSFSMGRSILYTTENYGQVPKEDPISPYGKAKPPYEEDKEKLAAEYEALKNKLAGKDPEYQTSANDKKTKQDNYDETKNDLGLKSPGQEAVADTGYSMGTIIYFFLSLFLGALLFIIYWYQTQVKKKFNAAAVPVSVLGQSYLDGSTRIVLLKVGAKVLVLAKSNHFCTTLETITDPNEVNMLTLGSGSEGSNEEFQKVLKDMNQAANQPDNIPNEDEIRQELSSLKSRLGNLR
ncbi:MAG: flagellar biosynthetic protein FliO [Planctomycetes bacterium]|nr:flagellar biosynthetic protein FliO [Planctomycetota bacterium]